MFNRVRSAIANAVGGVDDVQNDRNILKNEVKEPRHPYNRPLFLNLDLQNEVPLSADRDLRPIIVPRDRNILPWLAGYAECINAGKSPKNEDQAVFHEFNLPMSAEFEKFTQKRLNIPCTYFGMFDGHAGYGAAIYAARELHNIIESKLKEVLPLIWDDLGPAKNKPGKRITRDYLVVGALERSFLLMDQLIAEERDKFLAAGGCTALVCLFILGRVYISNAGDSRAIHCTADNTHPLSTDFTPASEKTRIRKLAEDKPELLCGEYTAKEYQRDPRHVPLGDPVLYQDASMAGWAVKPVTSEDCQKPLISGDGKKSRLMGTIAVTRGFGDHDLRAINSRVHIKPFLSAHPKVGVIDLNQIELTNEDVIIMATDGLWDVTTSEKALEVVSGILTHFHAENHRYISAAQSLVAHARGKPFTSWSWRLSDGKPASSDDVSVFVIPLMPHKVLHNAFISQLSQIVANCSGEDED